MRPLFCVRDSPLKMVYEGGGDTRRNERRSQGCGVSVKLALECALEYPRQMRTLGREAGFALLMFKVNTEENGRLSRSEKRARRRRRNEVTAACPPVPPLRQPQPRKKSAALRCRLCRWCPPFKTVCVYRAQYTRCC